LETKGIPIDPQLGMPRNVIEFIFFLLVNSSTGIEIEYTIGKFLIATLAKRRKSLKRYHRF
jgi:hypothetical protein